MDYNNASETEPVVNRVLYLCWTETSDLLMLLMTNRSSETAFVLLVKGIMGSLVGYRLTEDPLCF